MSCRCQGAIGVRHQPVSPSRNPPLKSPPRAVSNPSRPVKVKKRTSRANDPSHQPRSRCRRIQQPTNPCRIDSRTSNIGRRQYLVKSMARGASTVAGQIIDGTAVAVGQTRLRMERVKTKYTKGICDPTYRYVQEDDDRIIVSRTEFACVKWFMILTLIWLPLLTFFWIWYFRGGLAWFSDHLKQFNYHPLLMVLSVITISGFSMLLYRFFRCCRRLHLKIWHFILHAGSLALAYGGVYAAQAWHNRASPPVPHYYSLHSWMGLFTLGLYMVQLVFGFLVFLLFLVWEKMTAKCRAHLVPVHSTIGLISFTMAVSTCIQGINEKCIENFAWRYPEWPPEAALMNVLGMLLVLAGMFMTYLLLRTDFRYCGPLRTPCSRKTFVPEGHYCFRPHYPTSRETWRRRTIAVGKK